MIVCLMKYSKEFLNQGNLAKMITMIARTNWRLIRVELNLDKTYFYSLKNIQYYKIVTPDPA